MKLRNYLYKVIYVKDTPEGVTYSISLRGECPIYAAHFPAMPITPGVCILQMVEELLADYTHKNLRTAVVKNAKFLSMLKPTDDVFIVKLFSIKQEGEKIKVQSTVMDSSGTTYAKVSLICNVV